MLSRLARRAARGLRLGTRPLAAAVLACLLVLAAGLTGPALRAQDRGFSALPALGDAGELTALDERKLGDLVMRDVYRDPEYMDDAILSEYVDGIWQRLLAAARERGEMSADVADHFAWTVVLVRDRTINAFSLPGGYFGLNLGLVATVSSRDELASVLAHELSHVTQRHIARLIGQQKRQQPLLLAAMVLGALAASKDPQAGAALATGGQAALIQQQLNFSRSMEREADRVGYGILTQAGFAPQGFVSMFEKLQAASRLSDNGDWPWLRTHPLTTERIADMQQRQHRLPPRADAAPDVEALLMAARARVLASPGVDRLQRWVAEPARSDFDKLAPAQQAGILYAAALAAAQLRDADTAAAFAQRLQQRVDDPAGSRQVVLLRAELALRGGQAGQALALLSQLPPPAGPPVTGAQAGRAVLFLKARAQLATGQARPAASALQGWLSEHRADAAGWQLLASALDAQGRKVAALRAEGEAQFARLDYAGAIDRLRAAQDLSHQPGGAADRIEASIVDVRLNLARERLKQQERDEKEWD